MPQRSPADLYQVAEWHALNAAFHRAAKGKRQQPAVRAFAVRLSTSLVALQRDILEHRAPLGAFRTFTVHDPKKRRILAPCFADRVLHHALMAQMGPVLDRALVDDTYACRVGKGSLAAVLRAQHHAQRFPWFVKTDIQAYFASINHKRLMVLLSRRFKNPDLLQLCARLLACTPDGPPRGLPIGALTSQYFANTYLAPLDRFLLEGLQVRGMVRYMDDTVWWCNSRAEARATLAAVQGFVAGELDLTIKPNIQIGRSTLGMPFLGFRVFPRRLALSLRRRRRYALARAQWESAWLTGMIDMPALQAGMASALAITAHAQSVAWRREQLRRRGCIDE